MLNNLKFIKESYNGVDYLRATTSGKLKSFSTTPVEKSNGNTFYPAVVQINGSDYQAMINEGNFNHPDADFYKGGSYQCSVNVFQDNGVIITVSHLTQAERATLDFAALSAQVSGTTKAAEAAVAKVLETPANAESII